MKKEQRQKQQLNNKSKMKRDNNNRKEEKRVENKRQKERKRYDINMHPEILLRRKKEKSRS